MNDNVRFAVIVAVVLVVVCAFFWFVFGDSGNVPEKPIADIREVPATAEPTEMPPMAPPAAEPTASETPSQPSTPERSAERVRPRSRVQRPTGNGVIRGKVTWRGDEGPAAGAEVTVELQDWTTNADVPNSEKTTWTTTTDSDGEFQINRLPFRGLFGSEASRYAVMATKDSAFGMASVGLTNDETEGYVKIELDEVGTISGRVVNAAKEPVVDAFVFPDKGKDDRYVDGTSLRVTTGEDGRFELVNLPLGEWKLAVRASDYAVKVTDFVSVNTRDVEIVLSKGGAIAGVVVLAPTGEPVSGTKVLVSEDRARWNQHTVTTDTDGRFTVAALADGKYNVRLDDPDRVIVGEPPAVEIVKEDAVENVKLTVALGGVVTGRTYDADTLEPIAGVHILDRFRGGRGSQSREAVSDNDGAYRLTGLMEGDHTLQRRWKPGYLHGERREDKTVALALGQQVDGIDFAIKKGLYLRGIVVDTQGNPIERVEVTSNDTAGHDEGESTTSKQDGTFEHRGFSPNTQVTIAARREGFSAKPVGPLTIGNEDLNDVKIVMEPGASIAGVVVEKTGKPVANVYVNAQSPEQGYVSGDTTDRDGQFKVEGLAAGTYSMMLRPSTSGYRRETRSGDPITVAKAQALTGVRLVLTDEKGLTILGRVTNTRREPIKDAYVNAHSRSGGSSYGYAQTDADGRYEVAGLLEGPHMVNVGHNDYSQAQMDEVAAGSRNVDFVLDDQAAIEGRVVDARTGQPLTTFQIGYFNGITDRIHPQMFQNMTTYFDENGVFQLTRVNAGDVTVLAKAEGYAPTSQAFSGVRPGQTVTGVELRLETGSSAEGVVVDSRGVPISGAQVFAGEVPNDRWSREQSGGTTTDANGRFSLTSLGPDITFIGAVHSNYPATNVPVELVPAEPACMSRFG